MKKLFGILILFCILASCKSSKANCEAYGNNTKQTDKDRSDDPRNMGCDSSYRTKK
jgi:hypothetical protein